MSERRLSLGAVAALSIALMPAARAESTPALAPGRVLVMAIQGDDANAASSQQATALVAQAIARGPDGWSAVTLAELDDLLGVERTQMLLGCKSDATCLATNARDVGPAFVVTVAVGLVGVNLTVSLSLADTRSAAVRNRVSGVVVQSDKMGDEVRQLVQALFGWSAGDTAIAFGLDPNRPASFAVFDLQASGVGEAVAKNLTQVLADEVKALPDAKVIGRDDIVALLSFESDKQMLGCADDSACLAEIGGALGVSYLVAGNVGRVADTYVVALRLLDPGRGTVENRITESFSGAEAQLVGAVRQAARALLGRRELPAGALAVASSEPEARLFIDGADQGTLPGTAVGSLTPGRHSVRVSKDDFEDWHSDVYVEPGANTPLRAQLVERPVPWFRSWWFWTLAAGVVAVGAGTTVGVVLGTQPGANGEPTSAAFPGIELEFPR